VYSASDPHFEKLVENTNTCREDTRITNRWEWRSEEAGWFNCARPRL